MSERILVLNAGSSSLKFAVFKAEARDSDLDLALRGQIEGVGREPRFEVSGQAADEGARKDAPMRRIADHDEAIAFLLRWLRDRMGGLILSATGHRVVHGGPERTAPELVTPNLREGLTKLNPLAPHHQPHNLAAIAALARQMPDLPQVACFDTAFHATQPEIARRLALPQEWWDRGLRRYGFHGLSYEYIVAALPALNGGALPRRLAIAHLGNGASMAGVLDGRSVATTMGFSTLDGLVMGTRCGSLDPGVILHLMREDGMGVAELTDLLYNRSGLLGVSGISADMRTLLASDAPEAATAVGLFCYRIVRELGSLAAALGGLDGLVFTGGIGEHAAPVRAKVCEDARWLGIELDQAANDTGEACITGASSPAKAWVVPTNEELVIARHTRALVASGSG